MADPSDLISRAQRHDPRVAVGTVAPNATNDEPVLAGSPFELFQIGSITKVFTALALARAVVEGRLTLETPVGSLLRELARLPVGAVTLGALATHTSGLPRLPPELRSPRALMIRDPYAEIDHRSLMRSLSRTKLKPGGKPAYSNLGFGLLGHALAAREGVSYGELVVTRVTGDLGMMDTTCTPRVEVPGARRRGRPYPGVWHFDALAGAGALWSNVADLQRFARAQLEPPPGSLGAAIRLTQEVRFPGRMDQCLGWIRLRPKSGPVLFHNGGTAGFRSVLCVDRGASYAAIGLGATDRSLDRLGMSLVTRGRSLAEEEVT